MTNSLKSMLIVSSTYLDKVSFKMIPLTNDCPYVEVIYNPDLKAIGIIGKITYQNPTMLPRLDKNGFPVIIKSLNHKDKSLQTANSQERVFINTFYEYYINKKEEILNFISMFAVNFEHELIKSLIIDTDNEKSIDIKLSSSKKTRSS